MTDPVQNTHGLDPDAYEPGTVEWLAAVGLPCSPSYLRGTARSYQRSAQGFRQRYGANDWRVLDALSSAVAADALADEQEAPHGR